CACVAIFIASTLIATTEASEPVSVEGVYLLLSDDIDVPAREAGILSAIAVTEGQFVNERDLLANIEDRQARLERDRVAMEVEVAKRQADKSIEIELAKKALSVAQTELQ